MSCFPKTIYYIFTIQSLIKKELLALWHLSRLKNLASASGMWILMLKFSKSSFFDNPLITKLFNFSFTLSNAS